MAFTIEDGSGVLGANSYASVQGFKDYWADRNVDVSAITDTAIQGLLVKATDYIDTRWGSRFKGTREFLTMASRSILTLSAVPLAGETITVGSVVYTFRASPSVDLEVEIGDSALESLDNLAAEMNANTNANFAEAYFPDWDVAALTVYTIADGVATTETLSNGEFDAAASYGASSRQQPLEFPRVNLRDRSGQLVTRIPDKIKEATYEYAYRANSAALAPDPVIHESGLRQTKNRSKVGPLESDVEFAEGSGIQITKPYPAADRLLEEYVRSGGVIRA